MVYNVETDKKSILGENMESCVRLIKIEINNFKNIKHGIIDLASYSKANKDAEIDSGDINGIYGQNGSGKTAVIDALTILKSVICGDSISYDGFGELCDINCEASFIFSFLFYDNTRRLKFDYQFNILPNEKEKIINITKEIIHISKKSKGWIGEKEYIFNNKFYNSNEIPDFSLARIESKNSCIFNDDNKYEAIINIAPISTQKHVSLFFNKLFYQNFLCTEAIIKSNNNEKYNEELNNFKCSLLDIHNYMIHGFQVINSMQLSDIYNRGASLMNIHFSDSDSVCFGTVKIITNGEFNIKQDDYSVYEKAIKTINIAIKSLVPNIELNIKKVNDSVDKNNNKTCLVNIYSNRNGKNISLRYESEGIKRIISLILCLIEVFNKKNYCLVVDEIDSGIFEFLLGKLVETLKDNAKGQLIFTSHNLIVLEKLDTRNIICTTVNPDNRFIHLQYVEKTNNIRSVYLRTLLIGGQKESLYDDIDLTDLNLAFREAGIIDV